MKKEKGSALVLTIVVIALLMVLVMNVIVLATNSAKISKIYAENNKLRLTARNGVDKGISKLSETSAVWNSTTLKYDVMWSVLDKSQFKFTSADNIVCNVKLDISNTSKPKIISEADNGKKKKTITATLDGNSFIADNGYVQKIPEYGLSVVGDYTNGSISISTPQDSDAKAIRVDGSVFTQVGVIKKEHSYIKSVSGAFTKIGSNQASSGSQWNVNDQNYWNSLVPADPQRMMNINMGILDIKDDLGNVIDKQQEKEIIFSNGSTHKIILGKYNFNYKLQTGVNTNATVAVVKVRGSDVGDFNELYHSVIATFPELLKSDSSFVYNKNIPYIVFMIDGDIQINGNKKVTDGGYSSDFGSWYPSVIMYCTGKITIQGFTTFDNSAVCARSIVLKKPASNNTVIPMLSIYKPDGDHHYLNDGSMLPRTKKSKLIKKDVFVGAFYSNHETWFKDDNGEKGLDAGYEKLSPYYGTNSTYKISYIQSDSDVKTSYINAGITSISDDSIDNASDSFISYITLIKKYALKCLTDNLYYAPNPKIIDWEEK